MNILVVDDEPDIVELVRYNLQREGFSVDTAESGDIALKKIRNNNYALIVLDLMLPVISGLELCRALRADKNLSRIPIIMLTAKSGETDKVVGLEMGADDYITKPFSPRELVARIKAVLRRFEEPERHKAEVKIGDLLVNFETYAVSVKDKQVKLSATEFRMLKFLLERKGKIFSRDQLLDSVWKGEAFVEPRTVDVHIRRLRSQIEDDPKNPRYIKTMRGVGYYFSGD
ncbi:MAG: response regulator transcription factor [Nitrospirae bacterium]|nr:response regulator transcription factor [Nitrospirota bacterium]